MFSFLVFPPPVSSFPLYLTSLIASNFYLLPLVLGIALVMTFYGMTAGLAVGVFNAALAFTLQVNPSYLSCSIVPCSAVREIEVKRNCMTRH
jgi:hypothetical protein